MTATMMLLPGLFHCAIDARVRATTETHRKEKDNENEEEAHGHVGSWWGRPRQAQDPRAIEGIDDCRLSIDDWRYTRQVTEKAISGRRKMRTKRGQKVLETSVTVARSSEQETQLISRRAEMKTPKTIAVFLAVGMFLALGGAAQGALVLTQGGYDAQTSSGNMPATAFSSPLGNHSHSQAHNTAWTRSGNHQGAAGVIAAPLAGGPPLPRRPRISHGITATQTAHRRRRSGEPWTPTRSTR